MAINPIAIFRKIISRMEGRPCRRPSGWYRGRTFNPGLRYAWRGMSTSSALAGTTRGAIMNGRTRGSGRRSHPIRETSQRGMSLLEISFSIAIFAALMGLVAVFVGEEQRRQTDTLVAAEFARYLEAAQIHASGERNAILKTLQNEALTAPEGLAVLSLDMADLAASGALSQVFVTAHEGDPVNYYGQSYRLLIRGVWQDDPDAATLTRAVIENERALPDKDWDLDDDDIPDRMSFEAILVTVDGEAIAANRGGPIALKVGGDGGFIRDGDAVLGPYGSWILPLAEYENVPGYTADLTKRRGRLAGLVALPGERQFGGLMVNNSSTGGPGEPGPVDPTDPNLDAFFARVVIPGREGRANDVQVDLEFDNGTRVIRNRDGSPVNIANIHLEGDEPGIIENVGSISCLPDPDDPVSQSEEFHIMCGHTEVHGGINIRQDATIQGDLYVGRIVGSGPGDSLTIAGDTIFEAGNVDILDGNLTLSQNNYAYAGDFILPTGHSLSQTPQDILIVPHGTLIDKPNCAVVPAVPDQGLPDAIELQPGIYAAVAASVDEFGVPLVGVVARAENHSPTQWRVVLTNYINEEGGEDTSDSYDVPADWGRILVVTRCFNPNA